MFKYFTRVAGLAGALDLNGKMSEGVNTRVQRRCEAWIISHRVTAPCWESECLGMATSQERHWALRWMPQPWLLCCRPELEQLFRAFAYGEEGNSGKAGAASQ